MKKRKMFPIVMGSIAAVLTVGAAVGNYVAFGIYDNALKTIFGLQGGTKQSFDENQYFEREFKSAEEASVESEKISLQVEQEGAVLLKNDNALPLAKDSKVSTFSASSADFIYGNIGGSDGLKEFKKVTINESLTKAGFKINDTLNDFYTKGEGKSYRRKLGGLGAGKGASKDPYPWAINEVPKSVYDKNPSLRDSYTKFNDAAIVVISRPGAENGDLPRSLEMASNGSNKGHFLELDENEKNMLLEAKKCSEKVIVILNTCNAFELGFLDDPQYGIDAALWVGGVGQFGIEAIGQILVGDVNPSGRLVDTYAYDAFSSPASQNFGNFAYVDKSKKETGHHYYTYSEGIYVGYKYYETRYEDAVLKNPNVGEYNYDEVVQFPFGHGLSYTNFEWSDFKSNIKGDEVRVELSVKNIGNRPGKDVVEIYYQAPFTDYDKENGVEKSAINLIELHKTKLLEPNEIEKVSVTFNIENMKSYDSKGKKTYILEDSNDYFVTAARNSHEGINNILKVKSSEVKGNEAFTKKFSIKNKDYSLDTKTEQKIENQFDDANGNKKYLSRTNWAAMDNFGLRDGEISGKDLDGDIYAIEITPELKETLELTGYEASGAPSEEFIMPTTSAKKEMNLIEMKGKSFNDEKWEHLLNQVHLDEMVQMAKFSGHKNPGFVSVGKPYATDSDGTSCWNSYIGDGINAGGMPNEVVQASTWNKELENRVGSLMGELALWAKISSKDKAPNLTGWYAPAMNIHRTPFGGRNFEYYSEDPILSGIIGSNVVKGATDKGIMTYIKHFAFNEQETNRMTDNVVWSREQALRETYLLPFEMSIKKGGSLGLMTAYNRIGTTWVGGSYNLLTNVLRKEWGFNGFVISDYMDGDYENIDQMLAAGGDAALKLEDSRPLTTDTAQAVTYLRRATKHLFYAFANSNGMNGIDGYSEIKDGKPIYHYYMTAIDIALGTLIIGAIGSIAIYYYIQREKRLWLEAQNLDSKVEE